MSRMETKYRVNPRCEPQYARMMEKAGAQELRTIHVGVKGLYIELKNRSGQGMVCLRGNPICTAK